MFKQKKQSRLLVFFSTSSKPKLFLFFTETYIIMGLIFGLVYWHFELTQASTLIDNFFFSYVTQSSLGYGTCVPTSTIGKILAIIQVIAGLCWFSFLPAIIVLRLINPAKDVFEFASHIVFYPHSNCFRLRYVNKCSVDGVDLRFDIRARIEVEDIAFNMRNFKVMLNNPCPPDARTMVSFDLRTKMIEVPIQVLDADKDYLIALHPGHISKNIEIWVRVACNYFVGTFHKNTKYEYKDILCGQFEVVTKSKGAPPNWKNFDKVQQIDKISIEFCRNECPFRPACCIINKVTE